MFGWLKRKLADRPDALEGYLDRFDSAELAYMGDLQLADILSSLQDRRDPYPAINLVSYIRGVQFAKSSAVEDTIPGRSAIRVQVRKALTKATKNFGKTQRLATA